MISTEIIRLRFPGRTESSQRRPMSLDGQTLLNRLEAHRLRQEIAALREAYEATQARLSMAVPSEEERLACRLAFIEYRIRFGELCRQLLRLECGGARSV